MFHNNVELIYNSCYIIIMVLSIQCKGPLDLFLLYGRTQDPCLISLYLITVIIIHHTI
jgi:hypothetical protein